MFVVAANPKLALINVLNYPNPVFDHTCFSFELNRANVPLQLSVKIFDQIGALVKEISGPFQSDGYRVECLDWDGLDNMGRALSKGVYIYKVAVSDEFGNAAHQSQRLVLIK
jgi:flagellar hook assembly protein FlgD